MRKYFLTSKTVFFTLLFISAFSQSQLSAQTKAGNIWCFGDSCELDFNSGNPVLVAGCKMGTVEGCASIADRNTGQLLFYTDGSYVWNRNNVVMPSNTIPLGGDISSSQSALIIPKFGNENIYYIFTVPSEVGKLGVDSGLRYTVIDMNLDGGLGGVSQQPIGLITPTSEKLTATKMANDSGYWVAVHHWGSNAFYVYPVTANGVEH